MEGDEAELGDGPTGDDDDDNVGRELQPSSPLMIC